mmetsp:Transcript_13038/g.19772  ORF Transcript_13038/g.19772 Transcript_13038/m.19772 type:complete len:223 (+) Transcript_13038:47-715(+)|eukprot:CAMPEP_0202708776 /NCGR_PEP_ID=MMETSP1385-20130828/20939_1 /ASSEMBLY_ACC=CAM_ASM_000861 /TAXON_ID=933848 /ORGANISM="Elphidium margaritaceum" /LENGTH=222 /DNA_ID=CAMNT_0049367841 /DNA_START=43 /DNA_END=711 /DNA_ORIENTATION=+
MAAQTKAEKLRNSQVYKQVALQQSDENVLSLKELFLKYAEKKNDAQQQKKDDEKQTNLQDLQLPHQGLIKLFKYCGITQLKEDKAKQDELVHYFDIDGNKEIEWDEVQSNMNAMWVMGGSNDPVTLQTLFKLFDFDNDGKMDKKDLKSFYLFQLRVTQILSSSNNKNKKEEADSKMTSKEIDKKMGALFDKVDDDKSGAIEVKEFQQLMKLWQEGIETPAVN